ncbi:MAG: zf-HC2 domain-containing protein [Candidatus Aminicenantes bacterium]|jgi:hypothetical protein
MNCKKAEKKISDLLDGRLMGRDKDRLEKHMALCSSCLSYKQQQEILRAEVRAMEKIRLSAEYAQDFSSRLKRQLLSLKPKSDRKDFMLLDWKWVSAAAGFLLVVFLILYFTVFQSQTLPKEESFVLSFEEVLGEIHGEIGSDEELEELFNSLIMASIKETMEELERDKNVFLLEDPFFRRNLTEEELKILDSEIKKDIES